MRLQWIGQLAVLAWVGACGGGGDDASGGQRAAGEPDEATKPCKILTATDVQKFTGVAVQRIDRNPAIGAGGTCVNFATPDGQAYLGVNRLASAGEFSSAVTAVPADVYPKKTAVPGLGEESVLFSSPEGMRYLVARQGGSGVVLFPLGEGFKMTDEQLKDLAVKALTAE